MRRRLVALTAAAPGVRDAAVAARERRLRRHSGHDRRQKNPRSREGPRDPSRAPRRSGSRHARIAAIHGLSMAEAPPPAHRCQTPSSCRMSTDAVPASSTARGRTSMHLQNLAARHPTQSAAGLQPLDIASDLRHVQTPPRLDARERALDDWTRLARMGSPRALRPRGLLANRSPTLGSPPVRARTWASAPSRAAGARSEGMVQRTSSVETEPNSTQQRTVGP